VGVTATISSELITQIVADAERSPHAEVCGLLLGTPAIQGATRCRNIAADPARRFEIDPADLIAAHRAARAGGPAVIGHYHSHPTGDPTPSRQDAADAAPDGSLWLIVGEGTVRLWRAVPDGAVHGRFDPVALRVVPAPATRG
jgi:desampylase